MGSCRPASGAPLSKLILPFFVLAVCLAAWGGYCEGYTAGEKMGTAEGVRGMQGVKDDCDAGMDKLKAEYERRIAKAGECVVDYTRLPKSAPLRLSPDVMKFCSEQPAFCNYQIRSVAGL